MRVKLIDVVIANRWNLLDSLVESYGGKRSDYQSAEVIKDANSHYLLKFKNNVETYINKYHCKLID